MYLFEWDTEYKEIKISWLIFLVIVFLLIMYKNRVVSTLCSQ